MIPDFQTIMLPLLKTLADGKEHSLRDTIDLLSAEFILARRNCEHCCQAECSPSSTIVSDGPEPTSRTPD